MDTTTPVIELTTHLEQRWAITKAPPATRRAARSDIAAINEALTHTLGRTPTIGDLTATNLTQAFATYATDRSASTVLRCRSTWSTVLDQLVAQHIIDGNPIAAIPRPKRPQRHPKPIEGWDQDALTGSSPPPNPAPGPAAKSGPNSTKPSSPLLATGVRSAELRDLHLGSITGTANNITITVIGKGNKERAIPTEAPLIPIIDRYID